MWIYDREEDSFNPLDQRTHGPNIFRTLGSVNNAFLGDLTSRLFKSYSNDYTDNSRIHCTYLDHMPTHPTINWPLLRSDHNTTWGEIGNMVLFLLFTLITGWNYRVIWDPYLCDSDGLYDGPRIWIWVVQKHLRLEDPSCPSIHCTSPLSVGHHCDLFLTHD